MFPEQAESFSVVSNGAECIMISKRFFFEKANETVMYHLRQVVSIAIYVNHIVCCVYSSQFINIIHLIHVIYLHVVTSIWHVIHLIDLFHSS